MTRRGDCSTRTLAAAPLHHCNRSAGDAHQHTTRRARARRSHYERLVVARVSRRRQTCVALLSAARALTGHITRAALLKRARAPVDVLVAVAGSSCALTPAGLLLLLLLLLERWQLKDAPKRAFSVQRRRLPPPCFMYTCGVGRTRTLVEWQWQHSHRTVPSSADSDGEPVPVPAAAAGDFEAQSASNPTPTKPLSDRVYTPSRSSAACMWNYIWRGERILA